MYNVYIYIYTEREREIDRHIFIHILSQVHPRSGVLATISGAAGIISRSLDLPRTLLRCPNRRLLQTLRRHTSLAQQLKLSLSTKCRH